MHFNFEPQNFNIVHSDHLSFLTPSIYYPIRSTSGTFHFLSKSSLPGA